MNPNVTDVEEPTTDLPLHGWYVPGPSDFQVDPQHINSQSTESLHYWALVLDLCDESVRVCAADKGGRDVFALGSVIVKSSHLRKAVDGGYDEVDYSYADTNEEQAIALARGVLKDVRVPEIYFAGKINGRQVLIRERLPGTILAAAYPYLFKPQKENFKKQARQILSLLHPIKPAFNHQAHNHVVPDPDILTNGRINSIEAGLLFSDASAESDVGFTHNDLNISNIIVDGDRIVGLVDWEVAGFFSWKAAGEVHGRLRTPQRRFFASSGLSEETLREITWWNDIYDDGTPESM